MKISFASLDGVHVNQHFGWCECFYMYKLNENGYKFLKELKSEQKITDEVDKLEYKISSLEDSDMVCVSQIGPKAANMVQANGIYPMKSSNEYEKIEDILNSLQKKIKDNPPIWLKRILIKNTQ